MASKYYSVVTDAGKEKLLQAANVDKKVNIVSFAVGNGNGSYYQPPTNMTALKNEVWRGAVNACYISEASENLLITESVIPATVGGFTIREMAIFDDTGTMIAVCNTPDTEKVKVSDGAVHELDLSMEIAISNTAAVELVVDPYVVTATKQDIANLKTELEEEIQSINITVQEEWQEAIQVIAATEKTTDKIELNMLKMAMVVSTLTDADVMGAGNVLIETFKTADDIIIDSGIFDAENQQIYA